MPTEMRKTPSSSPERNPIVTGSVFRFRAAARGLLISVGMGLDLAEWLRRGAGLGGAR